MKDLFYKLMFVSTVFVSAVVGWYVAWQLESITGRPWNFILGFIGFIASHFFINGVVISNFLFRKKIELNTPVFQYDESRGTIGFIDEEPAEIVWSDVTKIEITTNDRGPWDEDFWWLFFVLGREEPIAIPQGAKGNEKIFDVLEQFFDNVNMKEIQRALGSTSNAVFSVWLKSS